MRIVVDVPEGKEPLVLNLMHELGYPAHAEDLEISLEEVEESHIQDALRREQDLELSKTKSIEEVFSKYAGQGL